MKVYRIEHKKEKTIKINQRTYKQTKTKNFVGPYYVPNEMDWKCQRHSDENHPEFKKDIKKIPKNYSKHQSGFKDLEDLKKWFLTKELQKLHKLGYILAIYQVSRCYYGSKQVLFKSKGRRKIINLNDNRLYKDHHEI
jgi:hypothetical protein